MCAVLLAEREFNWDEAVGTEPQKPDMLLTEGLTALPTFLPVCK